MVDEILVFNQLRGRCVSAVCVAVSRKYTLPTRDISRCGNVGSERKTRRVSVEPGPLKADTPFVTVSLKQALKDCRRSLFSTLMLMFNIFSNDTTCERNAAIQR
jgi:hypothetical protein